MNGVSLDSKVASRIFGEAINRGLPKEADFLLAAVRVKLSNSGDRFEDILIYCRKILGGAEAWAYKGTTKPGVKGTQNPVEYKGVTGAAWVKEGFYREVYALGIHAPSNPAFAHEAFRQVGKLKFSRDTNKDGDVDEFEPIQEGGDTAINWHRASALRDEEYVGAYGIACFVGQNKDDHEKGVGWYKESALGKKNGRVSLLLLTMKEGQDLGIIF